ncbi:hypothetical protein [Aliiroseovarius sediminis]|uniref:hypothetical protein n=1 Tax=Aliiroseovarius sediminis TaxID=2925839 RepID=UPI001F5772E6|nr:hypothetical protein [Aliiroseovarius sediminis]MCI2393526.1 hypothetical protein [Aliiroseovarius sediminis]
MKKLLPFAFTITAASALSAMAFQSLPNTGTQAPEPAPAALAPASAGLEAAQLNLYHDDLNPILGAPVYDPNSKIAGRVVELMFGPEGQLRGMVLAVPKADDSGMKRVATEAENLSVLSLKANTTVVRSDIPNEALQIRPAFTPDYATDYH